MNRSVRTVKRWEKEEGLPVHRHQHKRLGTVYAYTEEVDAWLAQRADLRLARDNEDQTADEPSDAGDPEPDRAPVIEPGAPEPPRRGLVVAAGLALVTVVAALGYLALAPRASPPVSARVMLAVLPFENLSGTSEYAFLSDGLTDELINALGQHNPRRLGVIARTSSMAYKTAGSTIAQVASELGVDYVLEGSIRRAGDRLRVTAQLIRAADQSQVWAGAFSHDLTNIVDVQSQMVRAITGEMQITRDTARQISNQPANAAAYEATLRGRYFLERRTGADLLKAQESFKQAIAMDRTSALAHVGLADSYILSMTYRDVPASEAIPNARQEVVTALQLDDRLADAHAWMGVILCEYDWNWREAEAQFKRAIELNPNFAYAHKLYAEFLSYVGRFEEAIGEARLARQLDPVSIVNNTLVGLVLYRARRYDDALDELARAVELDARHPTPYLPQGLAYSMKGMHGEAVAALERARTLIPESAEMVAQLGYAYARGGDTPRARAALAELRDRSQREHVAPFLFALLHVALSEPDAALDWLERGYKAKDWYLCVLKTEPLFDSLREQPRFQDLVRRIGFP